MQKSEARVLAIRFDYYPEYLDRELTDGELAEVCQLKKTTGINTNSLHEATTLVQEMAQSTRLQAIIILHKPDHSQG